MCNHLFIYKKGITQLAFASDSGGALLADLGRLLLGRRLGLWRCRDLLSGGLLLLLLLGGPDNTNHPSHSATLHRAPRTLRARDLPDGLLALRLADLGPHVPLGHDVCEGGAHDGALELLCTAGALLGLFLLLALLVLAPGKHITGKHN